ncbi:hypothetical protein GB928_025180 [Shinella curvata]|uniref:Uncharacterized protein n=1 Tax=Shinella curvata TaxID=1817964 RepID=A0ABT8XMS2_9HYPH|nr:hypothetical protein [Shinella curvata]MCJ8056669.1 hypothetical protein [Shinella curvata]MDO6124491.1 hypothetical protein [Shinella curvata]
MMKISVKSESRVDILWLSALLAGLGNEARNACDGLGRAGVRLPSGRMCIDGGASALLAITAPGRRSWEAHVLTGMDVDRQDWAGRRLGPEGEAITFERRMYRGRGQVAVVEARHAAATAGEVAAACFERWHRSIGPFGRVYSVGRDSRGGVRIAWQIDRHVDVAGLIAPLIGRGNWLAAARSLDAVHGFDLARSSGPWSLSMDVTAPSLGWRLGSTRWAWALDGAAKRERLARWITAHGGDGGYACALHDLLSGYDARHAGSIGRAVEVDVCEGSVTAATAYLGATFASSNDLPGYQRRLTWAG